MSYLTYQALINMFYTLAIGPDLGEEVHFQYSPSWGLTAQVNGSDRIDMDNMGNYILINKTWNADPIILPKFK